MKKKLTIASLVAATLLAANVAWAAPDVTGKVHTVDVVNGSVTLESGQYYLFPTDVKLDGVKAGDQVTISVDDSAAKSHAATKITKSG